MIKLIISKDDFISSLRIEKSHFQLNRKSINLLVVVHVQINFRKYIFLSFFYCFINLHYAVVPFNIIFYGARIYDTFQHSH